MKTKRFNMDTGQKRGPQLHHDGKLHACGTHREETEALLPHLVRLHFFWGNEMGLNKEMPLN